MLGASEEILAHRASYLALERMAVEPYLRFVYDDAAQADLLRERLFDDGSAEFSAAHGRLLLIDGQAAGMICCMPAAMVARCRMKAAMFLIKSGLLDRQDRLRSRMELAGGTLMRLAPGDFYLSRIAVAGRFAGSGVADELMDFCEQEARNCGAARICLEVALENDRAIRFYRRRSFEELGCRSVTEAPGRSLSYLHMVKPAT